MSNPPSRNRTDEIPAGSLPSNPVLEEIVQSQPQTTNPDTTIPRYRTSGHPYGMPEDDSDEGFPIITNTSVNVLRQQMDDSNHEMVNMLTNQMGNVFNPIVQEAAETNRLSAETNRQVIAQLTRLCNFLGAPQDTGRPAQMVPHAPQARQFAQAPRNMGAGENGHQGAGERPRRNVALVQPRVVIQRPHEADQVLEDIRREEIAVEGNLTTLVERIMARNGLNTL